jgi:hypothetical protein
MYGRFFDGNQVLAKFYDEELYKMGKLDED